MSPRSLRRTAATGTLAFAVVNTIGAAAHAQEAPIDDLKWIVGCWSMQTARGETITERWQRAAPDTLAGSSRTVRGDRELGSEIMHIFARADTVLFTARPSGQAYTEFRATALAADSAVFENPAHDFPQRVSYRLRADSLHARVDGTSNGSTMSLEFPMRRIACEAPDSVVRAADADNWCVRIESDEEAAEGHIRYVRGSVVHVAATEFVMQDIQRIQSRVKEGGGAKAGAIAGGTVMGLFTVLMTAAFCTEGCGAVMIGAAVLGGVIGGVPGGIAGAIISPADTRWELVWARPEDHGSDGGVPRAQRPGR